LSNGKYRNRKEYARLYYQQHPEKTRASSRKWAKSHPEERRSYEERRKKRDPEVYRLNVQRRTKKSYEKHRLTYLSNHRNTVFNLEEGEYEAMLQNQDGKCAICKLPESHTCKERLISLAVDHDAKTGQIRGLLCRSCNVSLGHFKDDIDRLNAAIEYLRNAKRRKQHD
jgi:putative hemolysin